MLVEKWAAENRVVPKDEPDAGWLAFMERNTKHPKGFAIITSMEEWKKKNRVEDETKVFIIAGGYGDIKRALLDRGWVQNKDYSSPCFDLKWTLKAKDIDVKDISSHQLVNHFYKTKCITTKCGLTESLKNMVWCGKVDVNTFFPRSYDLREQEEFDEFTQEFK